MRNQPEVVEQLLSFAQNDEMIRAVIMNGSRVNLNAPKDIFCDYDVVFAVTDPKHFLLNQGWIKKFGELIIMQQNDCAEEGVESYIFLMLFTDGIRIDLHFYPMAHIQNQLKDSLKILLMDKDNNMSGMELPSETSYFVRKPSQIEFDKTMNEFWWCSTNIAKGIWRDELCYAKYMFDVFVRDCIIKTISWHIGVNHNWCVNVGKYGKWFNKYLSATLWESLEKTYAGTDYNEIWDSLFEAGKLVREMGIELADQLGYRYPMEEDEKVTQYLKSVRSLPKDADTFISI